MKLLNNHKENQVHNTNSVALLNKIEADIFYLDPPYNAR
ncbi:MAG: DNA adenine methylase [Capnocytophaga endodontalis]